MKGHFLPRKSKLVFLNNSMDSYAGFECQTPAAPIVPVFKKLSSFRRTRPQGWHRPRPDTEVTLDTERFDLFPPDSSQSKIVWETKRP